MVDYWAAIIHNRLYGSATGTPFWTFSEGGPDVEACDRHMMGNREATCDGR
jgi:hypothetical protein